MKKVFLFPNRIGLDTASSYSRRLFVTISRIELDPKKPCFPDLKEVRWDGRIESLPTDEKVIVRASSKLTYGWELLGDFCAKHGHLCFYDDHLVDAEGKLQSNEALLEAAAKFLGSK